MHSATTNKAIEPTVRLERMARIANAEAIRAAAFMIELTYLGVALEPEAIAAQTHQTNLVAKEAGATPAEVRLAILLHTPDVAVALAEDIYN